MAAQFSKTVSLLSKTLFILYKTLLFFSKFFECEEMFLFNLSIFSLVFLIILSCFYRYYYSWFLSSPLKMEVLDLYI